MSILPLTDVNGDGLLDIFTTQSRRVDNEIAPGILWINQGNRTWREDRSMMEYATTVILTDADGDGLAQEIMINRGFCFPQRDGPGVGKSNPEFGEFSDDVKTFCSTRPVGTTVIYKFNEAAQEMQEISAPYRNIQSSNGAQPSCCPHGTYNEAGDCSAISIASADLDFDRIADHIVLYATKLVFYFSSDRKSGELPIGKENEGLIIDLPDSCLAGETVQILDLNNSGAVDIIVMCKNMGTFLVYTGKKKKWTLTDNCNSNGSLGALTDESLFVPNYKDLFAKKSCKDFTDKLFQKVCKKYQQQGKEQQKTVTGLSLVDLNNDGFTDFVVSSSFGYLRFFYNEPSKASKRNRFVVIKLMGDGVNNNVYGIGATLVLTSIRKSGKERRSFREVSHHQHTSDKTTYQDERIVFGLGRDPTLDNLIVRWPNGRKQVVYLDHWSFSSSMEPIVIRDPPGKSFPTFLLTRCTALYHAFMLTILFTVDTDDQYFTIQTQSESGESLCLASGELDLWNHVETIKCSSPPPNNNTSTPTDNEQFKVDATGRLRNKKIGNFCLAPEDGEGSNLIELKLMPCKLVKSSWQKTDDGIFRFSGSKLALGIENAEPGQVPFLHDPTEHQFKQHWVEPTR